MITFYGDTIADNLEDPHISNRYLCQSITNTIDQHEHFTGHAQLDYSVFKYVNDSVRFVPFDDYQAGKNVVAIGLHGGWTTVKLDLIKQWFLSDVNRKKAWLDSGCLIILDYSEEGFTTEVFEDLWPWIQNNQLQDRILYVSSSYNVSLLYKEWCQLSRMPDNMRTSWYGFFPNWLIKDHGKNSLLTTTAQWTNDKRYMCLNRRPHPHRILLTTLLQRFKIVDQGAVSMPKHFDEKEVFWKPNDFDIRYQWDLLQTRANGFIDYLNKDFEELYARLPLIADTDVFSTNYALNLNTDYYKDYPINVISETLFFSAATFASEKIWKPMLMEQIFFVMAAPFYLQSMREMGFQTFSPFIDETYDTILEPLDRADEMVRSLKKVIKLSDSDFQQLLDNCGPILKHNKQLLNDPLTLEKIINQKVAQAIDETWSYLAL